MSEPFILQLYKEIERKSNIISVSFNNDFYSMTSSNWQQVELVFDKIVGQIGNLLKLENGKIKIGKGIKKVKASFQTSTNGLANDTFYSLNLKKMESLLLALKEEKMETHKVGLLL